MLMMWFVGWFFFMSSHPFFMVFMLILFVLLSFLYLYLNMSVVWFGLVLMLVMLSGVLVLFTYMASLSPNERFETKMLSLGMMLLVFMGLGLGDLKMVGSDSSLYCLKLGESLVVLMNLFMLVVLLMVMLVVIYMVSKFLGPLRVECESKCSKE